MSSEMNFLDFYEPPFYTDGIYIWANNGNMALMVDDLEKDCDALLSRTCEILNGERTPSKTPELSYNAPDILLNGKPFLVVRGWGSLKADGFSEKDAIRVQDEFAEWVISKLGGK